MYTNNKVVFFNALEVKNKCAQFVRHLHLLWYLYICNLMALKRFYLFDIAEKPMGFSYERSRIPTRYNI